MQFALIIPDGCADEPQAALEGLTPLQAARTPHMDEISRRGVVGRADNVPPGLPSGSDVATMSLFGYDPLRCHTGRAPIEAAAQGISLGPDDWAIRCNLVTVRDGIMRSFTAGQVPNDVAAGLMRRMQDAFGGPTLEFYSGVSYRNLAIHRPCSGKAPFTSETRSTPPHDIPECPVEPHLPSGPGSAFLRSLMERSVPLFRDSPENLARGEEAATNVWLWGLGRRPALESFHDRFGVAGAMITAVDLLRGMAALLGWKNIAVPGATGYLDTNYAAKGQFAIQALGEVDLVVVHVEATDEASHEGDVRAKVESLEQIDRHIVGPLLRHLETRGDFRILVSPDHPTFLRTKTHSHGFVPFAICGAGIAPDGAATYDEPTAAASSLAFPQGHLLMPRFLLNTEN